MIRPPLVFFFGPPNSLEASRPAQLRDEMYTTKAVARDAVRRINSRRFMIGLHVSPGSADAINERALQ